MPWAAVMTRNDTTPIARGGWLDALRFIVASLIILHHFQASAPCRWPKACTRCSSAAAFS